MRNQYLVPANSKKSQLIFGFFTVPDLVVCLIGALITIMLLIILKNPSTMELIIAIIPILFAALLVMPVRHYHNVMQLINNIIDFYVNTRVYYWKGWCVSDDTDE
ncbi:MAG: hypothetical protein PUD07_00980 [bacterium]|nr:hypothetical protein [bacterium]